MGKNTNISNPTLFAPKIILQKRIRQTLTYPFFRHFIGYTYQAGVAFEAPSSCFLHFISFQLSVSVIDFWLVFDLVFDEL